MGGCLSWCPLADTVRQIRWQTDTWKHIVKYGCLPRDRFVRNLICIQTDVAPAIPNPAFGHAQRRHFRENLPTQQKGWAKKPWKWLLDFALTQKQKKTKKIILGNKLIFLLALFYVFLLLVSLIDTKTLIKRNNRIELIENILGTSRAVFS